MALRIVALAALGLWLAGCAVEPGRTSAPQPTLQPEIMAAIRRYYESHAAEENNACSAPIMEGVTRSEILSDSEGRLVVDVGYKYSNYTGRRSGNRCQGFGNRRFTLTGESGDFRVIDMTGERRRGPSWRLIEAHAPGAPVSGIIST